MMNCCIARKKAREENAHRSQSSMEVDDVEETGKRVHMSAIVYAPLLRAACECGSGNFFICSFCDLFARRIGGGGILRVQKRGIEQRGDFVDEDAVESEAPAVEQARGEIGQTSYAQVGVTLPQIGRESRRETYLMFAIFSRRNSFSSCLKYSPYLAKAILMKLFYYR